MNKLKLLSAGVLSALALVSAASAQTAIYISGAPATRAIWNTAIYNTLVSQSTGSPTISKTWTGGTVSSGYSTANQIILTGGNIGGTPVTIYATWTGSTAGNQAVAYSPPNTNTAVQQGFLSQTGGTTVGGGNTLAAGNTLNAYPDFNLSDTFQLTTPFHGTTTVTSPATTYVTLTEATPKNPAITGFNFVTNNGSPSTLNNITTNLAQVFFTQPGGTALAQFTGNSADENTTVWPVGRDIGSGARYVLLAETGIGTANSSILYQYTANITSNNITSYTASASGTKNLISWSAGGGGYSSFSNVLTALAATSSAGPLVTYVTDSDAVTALASGAKLLSWNGVSYPTTAPKEGAKGTAPIVIAEGQYTFWSYLHVYYNSSFIQSNKPLAYTFANALDVDLANDTTTGAILNSDVNVARSSDGGSVGF